MFCPEPDLIRILKSWIQGVHISFPEWKKDGVVLGRMFCPEPLLIREPDYLATRRKFILNGRGMVVLGRMFYLEPLFIRELKTWLYILP
jgi:hypothetical protein